MQIIHAGPGTPVTGFDDIQSTVREFLAPIDHKINDVSPVDVSIRMSQQVLFDERATAHNLSALLGEYDLAMTGISAVSIGPGTKGQIHDPDWRTEERLGFMFPAINLLAELMPGDEAGITTNALGYRLRIDTEMPGNWAALTLNIARIVQHAVSLRDKTGKTIHVDLEVEPGAMLRDTDDIVRFYEQWLLTRGAAMLSDRMQVEGGTAAEAMLRHVRIALDTAHAAVVWDDPASTLDRFQSIGIQIGRLQVSAALQVTIPDSAAAQEELRAELTSITSDRLLQQVVVNRGGSIVDRYTDLPDALEHMQAGDTWRIHTHAPVIADTYGAFHSTRDVTAAWIREIASRHMATGLVELRSANWAIVPEATVANRVEMIAEEAGWVRSIFEGAKNQKSGDTTG